MAHLRRHRDPDGISDRDLVAAEVEEPPHDRDRARRVYVSLVGTAEGRREVAAHAHALPARLRHELLETLESLGDRGVGVAPAEALAGRREDGDLTRPRPTCQ